VARVASEEAPPPSPRRARAGTRGLAPGATGA
jgi:hypothetical protein